MRIPCVAYNSLRAWSADTRLTGLFAMVAWISFGKSFSHINPYVVVSILLLAVEWYTHMLTINRPFMCSI